MTTPGLEEARARLLVTLGALARDIANTAPARCPYRGVSDACTFARGCRNQRRHGAELRCSGEALNPLPASGEHA